MVKNIKLTFTNVPFRHNSAYVFEKRLKWSSQSDDYISHKYFLLDLK